MGHDYPEIQEYFIKFGTDQRFQKFEDWLSWLVFIEIIKRQKTVKIELKHKNGGKEHSNRFLAQFGNPYISVAKGLLSLHW